MSRASAVVLFPDGTVKFGLYNGTSDQVWPALFDTAAEAWGEPLEAYRTHDWDRFRAVAYPDPVGDVEDVTYYYDYGGGQTFPAKATRNAVVGPLDWDGFCEIETEGRPEWAVAALDTA